MLNNICTVMLVIIVGAMITVPAVAGTYTFTGDGNAVEIWGNINHWTPNDGPPTAGDTAIIPSGKTCQIPSTDSERAALLEIESGGKVEVEGDLELDSTSGATLDLQSGGELEIQDGGVVEIIDEADITGTLDVQDGGTLNVTNAGRLDIHVASITVDGLIDFPCPSSSSGGVNINNDVTVYGSGTMQGSCNQIFAGPNLLSYPSASYKFTIAQNATIKNFRKTQVDTFANHGTVIVNFGGENGSNLNFEILGNEAYGPGDWIITKGFLKSDDDTIPVWSTPGSPGTFTINGGTWMFGGSCDDFSDTLIFESGKFTYRDVFTQDITFRNCGHFTFGGSSDWMVIEVTDTDSFQVGGTCD